MALPFSSVQFQSHCYELVYEDDESEFILISLAPKSMLRKSSYISNIENAAARAIYANIFGGVSS